MRSKKRKNGPRAPLINDVAVVICKHDKKEVPVHLYFNGQGLIEDYKIGEPDAVRDDLTEEEYFKLFFQAIDEYNTRKL